MKSLYSQMMDVLQGRVLLDDAQPCIRSCVRLPLYQKSVEILDISDIHRRRHEIAKAPPLIRPYLEEEIMRVWELRRSTKQDT